MKKIRLLPLVLIAVTALLAVKVLGFIMGVEPLEVGPRSAVASGGEAPAGHGEAAPEASAAPDTSAVDRLTTPIDLADEYKKLKAEQEKGSGHGEAPAAGHGEAPAAAGHDAAPADGAAHGDAAATDAGHGAPADAKPADAGKDTPPPATGTEAAPAGHDAAPAADAGHGAPAAGGADAAPAAAAEHGAPAAEHGAPAEGGHGGAKAPTDVYTERPKEYSPPIGSSERAILEGLAARRDDLDKRAHDLDLRAKLLEATEQRLNERLNQLQSIESQLGVAGGGGAPAANPAASGPASSPPAGGAPASGAAPGAPAAAGAAPAMNEQMAALVSLYEGMKPKAAAAVFDKLDTGTLLELAGHMNPRKLSPILAAMDPDKASRITSLMVGAQQAQKRVVVQVEQVAPTLGPAPGDGAPADASQLPQIMPAP
ncbi:hypothetical protein ANOBCDAF_00921 [Pleomorphomonas sp. T1.2MG-36]|uniref:MotE family protein n=1 Tax=Pleomorphomonas sp. T1.2MG-36 TaxID=3041167 RepID=UPI0024773329|nr:hypothetical protein [Pleomorphomonas sp. T1.2MG-36]CAI9402503.1 hypothetical protein ANOBCDAF_00921 [Pleomorphomonas sp. T1.2MG-36]